MTIRHPALTPSVIAFMASEEGIVLEAYRDGKGYWTWSMGVAETGGNDVMRYKDKPQSLETALRAAIDLVETRYLPEVVSAFPGVELSDTQLAGALSFHWRNGAIHRAQWVEEFLAGKISLARKDILNWTDHGRQVPRCTREALLFFDHKWPKPMVVPVYSVAKPSYKPVQGRSVDVIPILTRIMGAAS
jgi:GH24 family phage-related lysozyme (muramidase)